MSSPPPIKTKYWLKYLEFLKCKETSGSKHRKYKCPGCLRSIMFDRSGKEIPYLHVQTNLKNIGKTMDEFKDWVSKNC